jgi:hypothetical protein
MKINLFFAGAVFWGGMSLTASAGQFTADEVAGRTQREDLLKSGKIVRAEDIGEGVTRPKRLLLRKGNEEAWAVWKRPGGTDAGTFDKWECEIAAYRMDKLLGLGLVPPTVERRYKMYPGSLQLWADLPVSEKRMAEEKIAVPPEKQDGHRKIRAVQRAFDSLIGNSDRSLQNLRYTADWRMILIDHSRAFRDSYPYANRLLYGKNGIRTNDDFWPLPRALVEKMRALTYEKIRQALEGYLTSSEIDAVLVRRNLLLREIDELVREKGEGAVLY